MVSHLRLDSFLPFGKIDLKFWVHQAMHSITLEMVRKISQIFFVDLREISHCEIYHRGSVFPRNPPPLVREFFLRTVQWPNSHASQA